MISRALPLAALLAVALLLVPASARPAPLAPYVPRTGDEFVYYETIYLNAGTGNYTGYTESSYLNGSVGVTLARTNGTESATYGWVDNWSNNQGASQQYAMSGNFTFNASAYEYRNGTDDQVGYTVPIYLWFLMDNALGNGASFYLLNTQMHVVSTDQSYPSPLSPTGYARTIYATGAGSYERNDVYGIFNATYSYASYFDPGTGYVVGYEYVEHDSDGAGDGFTWTDSLAITSATYSLAPAAAPASTPASPWTPALEVGIALLVLVVVIVLVVLLLRSRRRSTLPRHSSGGAVGFAPVGGRPPPISLTPAGQPAVQQIVMKETVKVNCRYCGALIDTTVANCPNCGAPRT